MIPASYFFRDVYDAQWINPSELQPVDLVPPPLRRNQGFFIRLYGFLSELFAAEGRRTPKCETVQ